MAKKKPVQRISFNVPPILLAIANSINWTKLFAAIAATTSLAGGYVALDTKEKAEVQVVKQDSIAEKDSLFQVRQTGWSKKRDSIAMVTMKRFDLLEIKLDSLINLTSKN